MINKTQCPNCGRHFSEHLIRFPIFFDNRDETMAYHICPICAYEKCNQQNKPKKTNPFSTEHAYNLYLEAQKELKASGEKIKPVSKDNIKWIKLVRLTKEEKDKVIKKNPNLLKD